MTVHICLMYLIFEQLYYFHKIIMWLTGEMAFIHNMWKGFKDGCLKLAYKSSLAACVWVISEGGFTLAQGNARAWRRKYKTELAHFRERAEHVAARASGFVSRAQQNVRERVRDQAGNSWDITFFFLSFFSSLFSFLFFFFLKRSNPN